MLTVQPAVAPLAVHPHGRGDNRDSAMRRCKRCGSPPRAWGQYRAQFDDDIAHRFTPTGVGTITRRPVCTPSGSVHPHGRGDNYRSNFPRARFYGSPPRAWGQLFQKQPRRFPSRFTPTGVGTMPTLTPSPTPTPVHPHGRGDNGSCCGRGCGRAGSPPRAWGQ